MRISFKKLRRLALGLLIALALIVLILWIWVIPRAIVSAIRQRYDGDVTIAGWWVNGSSAGVTDRVPSFCHGSLATTKSVLSRSRVRWTASAVSTWPAWMGSKVPPNTPMRRCRSTLRCR